ncbi:uncharacterized protein LOC132407253 [Hypanus sabinus]|uniref:uncharacterized protein LOC132407253 n=1 Tax=Hypanus sabinus TaxID=79690 RepID=UPI0028C50613|nr:uncharacterized protein LOC132407253 [Hypanus sabinus]
MDFNSDECKMFYFGKYNQGRTYPMIGRALENIEEQRNREVQIRNLGWRVQKERRAHRDTEPGTQPGVSKGRGKSGTERLRDQPGAKGRRDRGQFGETEAVRLGTRTKSQSGRAQDPTGEPGVERPVDTDTQSPGTTCRSVPHMCRYSESLSEPLPPSGVFSGKRVEPKPKPRYQPGRSRRPRRVLYPARSRRYLPPPERDCPRLWLFALCAVVAMQVCAERPDDDGEWSAADVPRGPLEPGPDDNCSRGAPGAWERFPSPGPCPAEMSPRGGFFETGAPAEQGPHRLAAPGTHATQGPETPCAAGALPRCWPPTEKRSSMSGSV